MIRSAHRARWRFAIRASGLILGFSLLGAATASAADLNLPVPTAVVYPGQMVLDRGVMDMRFKVPGERLSAYVVEEGMLKNRVARRTLLPNQPILLSDLKSPDAVTAGQPAKLVYRAEGLIITGMGIPLQSVGAGEPVRVRNADSGVTISGIAAEDGSIEVSAQ